MGNNTQRYVALALLITPIFLTACIKASAHTFSFHQTYRVDGPSAPYITTPKKAVCTVNVRFAYEINATNYPTKFNATGLPPGLTIDNKSGWITGIVRKIGATKATVLARNSAGVGKMPLTISIVPAVPQAPYGGSLWSIPGSIETENFDLGGEGVAYHDYEASNMGGQYRDEGVDICKFSPPKSGNFVAYVVTGEWLKYSIFVTDTDFYKISFNMSTGAFHNQKVHFEIDDTDVTGPIELLDTGGWDNWQPVSSSQITLNAGKHVLKFCFDTSDYNVSHIVIEKS